MTSSTPQKLGPHFFPPVLPEPFLSLLHTLWGFFFPLIHAPDHGLHSTLQCSICWARKQMHPGMPSSASQVAHENGTGPFDSRHNTDPLNCLQRAGRDCARPKLRGVWPGRPRGIRSSWRGATKSESRRFPKQRGKPGKGVCPLCI